MCAPPQSRECSSSFFLSSSAMATLLLATRGHPPTDRTALPATLFSSCNCSPGYQFTPVHRLTPVRATTLGSVVPEQSVSHVQLGVQDAEDTCYVGKADGRLVYLVRPSVIDSDILSLTSLWPTFPIQHNGQILSPPSLPRQTMQCCISECARCQKVRVLLSMF